MDEVTPDLVERFIRLPEFQETWSSPMLSHLGMEATIPSALDTIAIFDIDVVDISDIDRYLADEFEMLQVDDLRNDSIKFLPSFNDLHPGLKTYILGTLCPLDTSLYEILRTCPVKNDSKTLRSRRAKAPPSISDQPEAHEPRMLRVA